mgnify:CR=1 FL=1
MEDFASYLYRARISKNRFISQRNLSELSGYSQTYISLIETGKAKPSGRCKKVILETLEKLPST